MDFYQTEEEYRDVLDQLLSKYQSGKELRLDEQLIYCDCLNPKFLRNFSFCEDTRFSRLYLEHFISLEGKIPISQEREDELDIFVTNWEPIIKKGNNSDQLIQEIAKETRVEIKNLKSIVKAPINSHLFRQKEREILLHSKFIYIKVKRIFGLLRIREAITILNDESIYIDGYSLIHIIFRHYAKDQKPYPSDKSFFMPPLRVDDLLTYLLEIITRINNSGFYKKDEIQKIYFEYYNNIYTIYCKKVQKQEKGLGNFEIWRLNTFYPTELLDELFDIYRNYQKQIINKDLSVFIKIC
jgi:hypothetical protein